LQFGHEGVAKHLLAAGTDLNLRNKAGQTALDVAIEHGHTVIVALIRGQIAKL
jgi:ankyrin repeat protein